MTETVEAKTVGAVRVITLNRPARLNAINRALLSALVEQLRSLDDAGALVLQGAGRAFCAGEDLKDTLAPETKGQDELRVSLNLLQEITRLLTSFPGAVVAAVHGFAVGGGVELALAADIIVASPETRFRFPEVAIGHALTGGITGRLPALVGLARAKELFLTSRWFDAHEAVRIGMITELASDPKARALVLAQQIGDYPRRSVAATKYAVELAAQRDLDMQLRWEVDAALNCFSTPEANEIFTKFQSRGHSGTPIGDD